MFIFHGEIIDYNYFKAKTKSDCCVVFLHGWGGDKHSFQTTVNLISHKHNVLTITLPTTRKTNLVWDLDLFAECVISLLNNLSIKKIQIVCHSFGFRVATIMSRICKKIIIEKMIITGGAGLRKTNFFKKINKNNTICLLKHNKNKNFYKKLASSDYRDLSPTNKKTFQNVINLNTCGMIKFNFPILIFWGKNDKETPLWMAKKIFKENYKNATFHLTKSDHFAYLKLNSYFNNLVVNFL